MHYRGLHKFIQELRQIQTKEDERKRINKEMANIRCKFRDTRKLSSYDRRKYVCKLMYMYILDYDVEWGLKEVINLMASNKFIDKQTGYLAASLLFHRTPTLLLSSLSQMRSDLNSSDSRVQNLALTLACDVPTSEMCETLGDQVILLLQDSSSVPSVKSRSALTLRSLYEHDPSVFSATELFEVLTKVLQSDTDPTVFNSCITLAKSLGSNISDTSSVTSSLMENLATELINILSQCYNGHFSHSFKYHGLYVPWLQVSCLSLLSTLQLSSISQSVKMRLSSMLGEVLNETDVPKGVSKNCSYSILFESIGFCLTHVDQFPEEAHRSVVVIGKFLLSTHPNLKFMGLKACSMFSDHRLIRQLINDHQSVLSDLMRDVDSSIQKMSIGVAFDTADESTCQSVVSELLSLLTESKQTEDGVVSSGVPDHLREEIVLRIAILSESFAENSQLIEEKKWVLDSMFTLVEQGKESIPDVLWHRIVHFVINNSDVQSYALNKAFELLSTTRDEFSVASPVIRLGVYLAGEFGSSAESVNINELFTLLVSHFRNHVEVGDSITRGLFLNAFVKLSVVDKVSIRPKVVEILSKLTSSIDPDIQQRCIEYLSLMQNLDEDSLLTVLDAIPECPVSSNPLRSLLQRKVEKKVVQSTVDTPQEAVEAVIDSPSKEVHQSNDLIDLVDDKPSLSVNDNQYPKWITCLVSEKAVLFENEVIQIGVRHEYCQSKLIGRIILFIGNKSSVDFNNVQFDFVDCDGIDMLNSSIPSTIASKTQCQIKIQATIKDFHPKLPKFNLQFNNSTFFINLPFTIFNFSKELDFNVTDKSSFIQHWSMLQFQQQELFDFEVFDNNMVSKVLKGLRFSLYDTIDPNPNSFLFGFEIDSAKVLARTEFNSNALKGRITLKTDDKEMGDVLKELFCRLLPIISFK
ncbi:hypothetical protein P9112_007698 [Eukaryota sp. TZLM1-RC]